MTYGDVEKLQLTVWKKNYTEEEIGGFETFWLRPKPSTILVHVLITTNISVSFLCDSLRRCSVRHFGVAQCWQAQHIAVHRNRTRNPEQRNKKTLRLCVPAKQAPNRQ